MKPTHLNYLFIDQVPKFVHLITVEPQTKQQFANRIRATDDVHNPKTQLFYMSTIRSEFDTIRLNEEKTEILFNQ